MSQLGNRVKETTDTTGTGTLDLGGAATGFRGFSDEFASGARVRYLIVDDPANPTEYEYGLGVFTTGTPSTLTRETVKGSSNSGNKVSFSAGAKTVIATPIDDDIAWRISAKTGDYTVTAADHKTLFLVDGSGNSPAGATITLPAIADVWPGFEIEIKRTGATGTITYDGNGSETIDGATTGTLASQYDVVKLRAGSSEWHKAAEVTSASSEKIAQIVSFQTGAVATGTTTIPLDDTKPQNTEGDEYMTLAITPTSASNKLRIDVTITMTNNAASTAIAMIAALFQDSTADALDVGYAHKPTANRATTITFSHVMDAGTTSATTFKVRGGCDQAGTTTFNGANGGRLFGGVLISSIRITEYEP